MTGQRRGSAPRSAPSIADVARLAGVSSQTVSRVSTGAQAVKADTRDRVLRAMTELGYSPNRAARALRRGAFGSIGIITQQLERTGDSLTTAAIVSAAQQRGDAVTLVEVRHPESAELADVSARLSHSAIDGLIIVRAGIAGADTLSLPPNLPVVVSDSRLVDDYPSVVPDQAEGTRLAVAHLLSLGHRTVHHISGAADSQPAVLRAQAWRDALHAHGISAPAPFPGDWSARSGYRLGQELAEDPHVTAVYCANDEMAFGLLRALQERGRRVPDDVSVVGFDGIALSEFSFPPLTTVHQDFRRIGSALVELLATVREMPSADPLRTVVVPVELVVRGTTAPPRR